MLKGIRYKLNSWWSSSIEKIPGEVGKLTHLSSLESIKELPESRDVSNVCTLECLKHLNHLRGSLILRGLGNVTNSAEAKNAQLTNKINLIALRLSFDAIGIENMVMSLSSSSVIAFPKMNRLTFWDMRDWEDWDFGDYKERRKSYCNYAMSFLFRNWRLIKRRLRGPDFELLKPEDKVELTLDQPEKEALEHDANFSLTEETTTTDRDGGIENEVNKTGHRQQNMTMKNESLPKELQNFYVAAVEESIVVGDGCGCTLAARSKVDAIRDALDNDKQKVINVQIWLNIARRALKNKASVGLLKLKRLYSKTISLRRIGYEIEVLITSKILPGPCWKTVLALDVVLVDMKKTESVAAMNPIDSYTMLKNVVANVTTMIVFDNWYSSKYIVSICSLHPSLFYLRSDVCLVPKIGTIEIDGV
ncbi:hypothetical protein JRO89_XS09G0179000 [Xanthoceras sorbifolium]|uniref:R13L1/DRL21-like LRR repeat region domain-containing protein n=1 Tax=Xanthoceras sorbifolium TaxID=99658 RepID=A0ABQ8HLP2_9ROSI|nr:hypothetical protein JRO89_XS09G0179000 [Xanthoceras sorbifolium]